MRVLNSCFSTGEPAYAVNREGVIVAWNPAAERSFGYAESEAVGWHCWELLAGEDLFGNRYCCKGCPLREMAFRHQSVKSVEILFRTATSGTKQFDVCTLIVYEGPGNELLVHLCHPSRVTTRDGVATAGNSQPSGNHMRDMLTRREKEVLTLLAQGKGTTEVASDLCISTATVRNHTQHIFYKLNVHGRIAAIIRGEKLGLI